MVVNYSTFATVYNFLEVGGGVVQSNSSDGGKRNGVNIKSVRCRHPTIAQFLCCRNTHKFILLFYYYYLKIFKNGRGTGHIGSGHIGTCFSRSRLQTT